ncbi:MAG: phosphatase, partial [Clostridiales bacterium]|nr:phosphatase [Clostridiales bacterium]
MNIIADTHLHTLASTHAYSSLQEMIHAAALKKLYVVAVTDHGVSMPGSPRQWYFHNMTVIPRRVEGVVVLRGQETNVVDYDGNIDLETECEGDLDWIVASIHDVCMPEENPTMEQVTNLWLRVAADPRVNVIGHSGSKTYQYDYETVIPEFGRQGKLVEVNEGTFRSRAKSVPNCVEIMKCCKKHGVPIVVNSDSHFSTQVGCFEKSLRLLEEVGFPEELVINSSVERFNAYLKKHTRVF